MIFVCLGISFCYSAFSQSSQGPSIEKVVPATPQASALSKYISYEVTYNNGLPNIQVPLYEIKDGDITIPISLSYHASGIKVNQLAGWEGLGWTLNAEPLLTRAVKGKPDENNYLQDIPSSTRDPFSKQYLKSLAEGSFDEQPDEFFYSLGSKQGKFYLRKDYQQPIQVIPVPYNHIRVNLTQQLNNISINDGNGLVYAFDNPSNMEIEYPGNLSWTGFKPSSITSLITGSKVNFSYYPAGITQYTFGQIDYISIIDSLTNEGNGNYGLDGGGQIADNLFCCKLNVTNQQSPPDYTKPLPIITYGINGLAYQYRLDPYTKELISIYFPESYAGGSGSYGIKPIYINQINFRGGSVYFFKSVSDDRLDSIRVYRGSQVLKTFRFYQSYFISDIPDQHKRLRLDSIGVFDAASLLTEKYKFDYNGVQLPNFFSKAMDLWGYYNGENASHDSTLVPSIENISARYMESSGSNRQQIRFNIKGSMHRNPNEYWMQLGMLKSIGWPTGGKTEFTYEAHRYKDPVDFSIKMAGGLRIKQIRELGTNGGEQIVRTFKYGVNEDGGGYLKSPMTLENFFTKSQDVYVNIFGFSPIAADDVTGVDYGIRRRTYTCNSMHGLFFSQGSPVSYPEVAEYTGNADGDPDLISGKTVYSYHVANNPYNPYYPKVAGTTLTYGNERDWELNYPTEKKVYKTEDRVQKLIKRTQYGFGGDWIPGKTFSTGQAYMARNIICIVEPVECDLFERVRYLSYNSYTSNKVLVWQKDSTYYDDHSGLGTFTQYTYDDSLNLVKEAFVDSRGDSVITSYTYPYSSTPLLNNHIANNLVTRQITKTTRVNNQQSEAFRMNYFPEGGGTTDQLVPSAAYHSKGSVDAEKRIQFSRYDSYNNLLQQSITSGFQHSYLWDYQSKYAVAEVKNADYNSIAYSSFETGAMGNWVISGGSAIQDANAPTGSQAYAMSSSNISKTGLNTSLNYIVSYWSKNGSASVNGNTTIGLFSKNGYTYYQHALATGISTVTVTGSVTIDELRLYPKDAQMTTYTYLPLTGMTSKCDEANIVTYYEYDNFGRLKLIRDQDRNIINTKDYNYKK